MEKIGFGTGQYERPYWSKAMNKINKKVGIIPRESGITASEWKNVLGSNKGYNANFKEYYTYGH